MLVNRSGIAEGIGKCVRPAGTGDGSCTETEVLPVWPRPRTCPRTVLVTPQPWTATTKKLDTDSMNVIRDTLELGPPSTLPNAARLLSGARRLRFNPLFVPVRNLLRANKDADGRRSEIFQVRHGG